MKDAHSLSEGNEWDDQTGRPKFASLCIKVIEQEWRSWESLLSEAHRISAERPPSRPDTPWAQDWTLVQGNEFLEGALAVASERFQRLMFAVRDYAETMLLLLKHDRLLVQPAWSAGRGAMEAVLLSCWLLDSTKSSEMRLARALSLLPAVVQGTMDTLRKFPGQDEEVAQKREVRNEIVAYLRENQVEVLWKLDKRHSRTDTTIGVVFRSNKASFNRNITQLAEWYLPDEPYLYTLLSGAAHSDSWLLEGIEPRSAGEALNSVVMPFLAVSLGYTRSVCSYFGIDARPYVAANERRLKALVLRGGGQSERQPDRQTAFGRLGSGFVEEFTRRGT